MLTAISAGWAFSVSVRSASGPSHISFDSFWPSASSTSCEHLAGGGEGVGQRLAHADGLAALARKDECEAHAIPLCDSVAGHEACGWRAKSSAGFGSH